MASNNAEDEDFFAGNQAGENVFSKEAKKQKSNGGFQGLGLCKAVLKGVIKKGYTFPTPIQRKTIPVALSGQDLVAMARTGSGKTAAFLVPLLESLKEHSLKVGIRAIILSPTRELAKQTMEFCRELAVLTDLRIALIVGGEGVVAQFEKLADNPDIIVATPGRLMHHLDQTKMTLLSVKHIVFDEADRLFEMGFAVQLNEILRKLPEQRQTMLFSATMPAALAEFARAGLRDPVSIRLDTEHQVSDDLSLAFFGVRHQDKPATLLKMLRDVIPEGQQTIVFASTKYHVEYLHELLNLAEVPNSTVHGTMHMDSRTDAIKKFRSKKSRVLLVTDVAARGIDIPLLENVINYDFPASGKLFIHRVGRVARAGSTGQAYSFVSHDEVPYMLDVCLYLGRTCKVSPEIPLTEAQNVQYKMMPDYTHFGVIPFECLAQDVEWVKTMAGKSDVEPKLLPMKNAFSLYLKSRSAPSSSSVARSKDLPTTIPPHQLWLNYLDEEDVKRDQYVQSLKGFRPRSTIFEIESGNKKQGAESAQMIAMRKKRKFHESIIDARQKQRTEVVTELSQMGASKSEDAEKSDMEDDEALDHYLPPPAAESDSVVKISNNDDDDDDDDDAVEDQNKTRKRAKKSDFRDVDFFMNNIPENFHREKAWEVKDKNSVISNENLDMMPDDSKPAKSRDQLTVWDRKKGKYKKLNKGESMNIHTGKIKAKAITKKQKNLYDSWTRSTKKRIQHEGETEVSSRKRLGSEEDAETGRIKYRVNEQLAGKRSGSEIRSAQQMALHKRKRDETHRFEEAAKTRRKKGQEKDKKVLRGKRRAFMRKKGKSGLVPEIGKGTNKKEKYKKDNAKVARKKKFSEKKSTGRVQHSGSKKRK